LLETDTTTGQYVGYEILAGTGCGMAIQTILIAVQVVVSPSDMAEACNMEVFFPQLGSSVVISLAENISFTTISDPMQKIVTQNSSTSILESGIRAFVDLRKSFPLDERQDCT
jgi:hypothetical protein